MKELDHASELKKLYDRLFEGEDSKKDHGDKLSSVCHQLDKKLGPQWRKRINPSGVELVELAAPVKCKKVESKDMDAEFFDKVRKMMLGENMEVGQLIDRTDLDKEKYHSPKPRSLMESVSINVNIKKGNENGL